MTGTDTPTAGRRAWLGLAVLALPCLLLAMDLSVLYVAAPSISADLEPSSAELLWVLDIYGFLLAGSLITMGNLGDRIGRRRLLMLGAAVFGATSIIAAFSTSAEMLIAARALMGVAAATLMPSTLGLIRTLFPHPAQRTTAIGIWGASLSLGGALGPLAGGVLLEFFWWGSVLLLAVPVMAGLLILAPVLLPESRNPHAGRLDLPSAALSLTATLAIVYGVKYLAENGATWLSALAIVAGVVVGTVFVRRQRTLADPLVDLALFRVPAFSACLGANALGFGVLFGIDLFLVQYLQLVLGLSPLVGGLWTVPTFAGFIAGGIVAPMLVRRIRPAVLMSGGLVLAAAGLGALTRLGHGAGLPVFVTGSVILSLGLAPVFTVATEMTLGSAPLERAGAASAISETSTELGGALGIALLGSIGAAVYRHEIADTVPANVSPEAVDAARDTLGAATAAAMELPAQPAAALLDAARGALLSSVQVTTFTAAVLAGVAAVLVAVLLRRAGQETAAEPEPAERGADAHGDAALRYGSEPARA